MLRSQFVLKVSIRLNLVNELYINIALGKSEEQISKVKNEIVKDKLSGFDWMLVEV